MLAPADQTFRLLTTVVEAFVVYLFLVQGLFRKFLFLNTYLLLLTSISVGRYAVLLWFGWSQNYSYFYYYSDALLTLVLFICVCELSQRVVGPRMPCLRVLFWGAGAFLATAGFTVAIASRLGHRMGAYVFFEFTQNIYFVCCLVVFLLAVWKLRNDSEDRIAARLVNILFVYFSLFVLLYGAHQLVPHGSDLTNLHSMMGAWLPLGCGFVLVT